MSTQQGVLNQQDPDYVSSVPKNEEQQKALEQNARASTARKLREIFNQEFSKEIDAKEKEVLEIQDRLQKSLKTLHLLRYFIVTDYYARKQCLLPEVQTESKQTRIHPAIKQLVGKRPRVFETNFIDVDPRKSAVSEPSTSKHDNNQTENNASKRSCENDSEPSEPPKKIPRYIPPKSSSPEAVAPSRGLHNKFLRKVVIGNISKWIPPEWRDDAASHKWTVYVRSIKNEVDVGEFLSKVRFFLHPTYKPHDVVEITSSPFHLTRRGWGEFPVRIQLHFKNHLNKPKDLIHYLKLDQTYTGLQTLGSETVYNIWLQSSKSIVCSQTSETKEQTKAEESCTENAKITNHKAQVENGMNLHNGNKLPQDKNFDILKLCIRNEHDYALMDYVVDNNRTIVHLPNGDCKKHQNNQTHETNTILQSNGTQNLTEQELADVVSHTDQPINAVQTVSNMAKSLENCPSKMQPLNITIPKDFEPKKKQLLLVKNNQLIPTNSSKIVANNKSILESDLTNKIGVFKSTINSKSISLSTANSCIFNPNSNIPALQIVDEFRDGFRNGTTEIMDDSCKDKKNKINWSKQKLTKKDIWEETMRFINNYKFTDVVSLVKLIIKRVPIITAEAADPEYKKLHPYSCASLNEFMQYNVGKQKYIEWYRAKIIRSFLKKLVSSEDELWTMREIMVWARQYGYTPIISYTNRKTSMKSVAKEPNPVNTISCTRTELMEIDDWFLKLEADNESHSDVEVDIENVTNENPILKKNHKMRTSSESNTVNDKSKFLEVPSESESLYYFVSETIRDCSGVKLNNETIFPGIKHCAAARVIMQSLQCLVSDVVRLAHAQALERCNNDDSQNRSSPVITESDVKGALSMREGFDIFTNVGLGTKQNNEEWNEES